MTFISFEEPFVPIRQSFSQKENRQPLVSSPTSCSSNTLRSIQVPQGKLHSVGKKAKISMSIWFVCAPFLFVTLIFTILKLKVKYRIPIIDFSLVEEPFLPTSRQSSTQKENALPFNSSRVSCSNTARPIQIPLSEGKLSSVDYAFFVFHYTL